MSTAAVILAAGLGKRMKSSRPKVLHLLGGRPLLSWVAQAARGAGCDRLIAVVGPEMTQADRQAHLSGFEVAVQHERLGTGHATRLGISLVGGAEEVVVLCGDVPLLGAATIRALIEARRAAGAAASVLTMRPNDPAGYGRIVRDVRGDVAAIVEHRDADEATRRIGEVNSGTYAFRTEDLLDGLGTLRADNDQGEYYLTDVVRHLASTGRRVVAVEAADPEECAGVNSPDQLAALEAALGRRGGRRPSPASPRASRGRRSRSSSPPPPRPGGR